MGSKVQSLDKALQYLRSKVPQSGMFSTLDELVQAAPFENAPTDQWSNYLKPGRVFTREGVNFPLKSEELQYSGLPDWLMGNPGQSVSKQGVLEQLRTARPEFNIQLGTPSSIGMPGIDAVHRYAPEEIEAFKSSLTPELTQAPGYRSSVPLVRGDKYPQLAHEASVPDSYQESVTLSPSFGEFPSHFTNNDLSWSRTTRHYLDNDDFANRSVMDPQDAKGKLLRLIEEIQSDRHQAAAEKIYRNPITGEYFTGPAPGTEGGRRGYRTPEQEALWQNPSIERNAAESAVDLNKIARIPPDTPFKNPEDYAGLEMRKQLLNAVNAGDSHLGIVRGADQSARYGSDADRDSGMNYMYDTIYPKALKKLATQYGAKVSDVSVPIRGERSVFPDIFNHYGVDNPYDFLESVHDPEEPTILPSETHRLLDEYQTKLGLPEENMVQARKAADDLVNEGKVDEDNDTPVEKMMEHLDFLHTAWYDKFRHGMEENKTFPSMEITPEVAERVRKAGVPLWSLAGIGTAAGLGAYDNQAQANPVEDQAMADANGYDKGGMVARLAKLAKALGRGTEEAAPTVEHAAAPSLTDISGGSGRSAPRDPRMEGLQSLVTNQPTDGGYNQWAVIKPNGEVHGAPFEFKGSALHVADGLNNTKMPGHTVQAIPTDLAPLDRFTPRAGQKDPLQKMTPEEVDALMSRTGGGSYSDPGNGMAEGGSFDPIADAAERVRGSSSPGSPGVSGAVKDAIDALKSWMAGAHGEIQADREQSIMRPAEEEHAEGGSTGTEDKGLGNRFLTRVREQAYGLDENGQPAFGGRAWTQGQGGTPMGFLDEVASVPHSLINLAKMTRGFADRGIAKHLPGYQESSDKMFDSIDPQWSQDASSRLDQLRSAMNKKYGVSDAHTLPEHLTDAAASLVSPIPAIGDAKAAGAAGRLLEMTTPLRPRTLKNFATDTGIMGGASAGIDALAEKLAKLQASASPGGGTPVDPSQFSSDMGLHPEQTANIHNNHQMVPLVDEHGNIVYGVDPQTF